ncbi:Transposase [Popillia japonica]|uniref:Transposase n=1 Tax=Popillia japonica TaxID=7064 RepID=A0AAW1HUP6_POPJA
MGRQKCLTAEEIGKIKAFHQEGYSARAIARKIGRSHQVVSGLIKDPENYGKRFKGRTKFVTTDRERRAILRAASNSALTARQIANKVGTNASVRTVQKLLRSCQHLKRLKMKRRPALKEFQRTARLQFAQAKMGWTYEWQTVIFSDEKKFNLDALLVFNLLKQKWDGRFSGGPSTRNSFLHLLTRPEEPVVHAVPSTSQCVSWESGLPEEEEGNLRLTLVMSTGLIMVATVCDQASQNVAGINALLQEIKQSYFRKNEEFKKFGFEVDEIVALYDYPHLVKCITNNFLTKDISFLNMDNVSRQASWKHVIHSYEMDQGKCGSRACPKLTDAHVYPDRVKKMKVKCCTQVLNRSVGALMGFLAENGML